MRISDWSSDVCSSDLGQDSSLAMKLRFPAGRNLALAAVPDRMLCPLYGAIARRKAATIVSSARARPKQTIRSEEHTSELQSLMRISYAVFCLKKKNGTTLSHTAPSSTQYVKTKSYTEVTFENNISIAT